jgi:hypothetical protein
MQIQPMTKTALVTMLIAPMQCGNCLVQLPKSNFVGMANNNATTKGIAMDKPLAKSIAWRSEAKNGVEGRFVMVSLM